jgi:acyl-CoA thioesterase-1
VPEPERQRTATAVASVPAADERPLVVFLGDSIAAGFQLPEEQAFPAVCGELLRERGIDVRVVNAGVSGDTSAGGLGRLGWLLAQRPDLLVVELGGNDGLRGLAVEQTEANLRGIVERSREAGVAVLLLAMQIPPSYGADYTEAFRELYPRLADELGVPIVEDFLEGVGGEDEMNLADGIHPTAEGHRRLADNVLPALIEILERP